MTIADYYTVLQYDSCEEKKLLSFDRMLIHKRIASLLASDKEAYELPEKTENKVKEVWQLITTTNWTSPEI